MRRALFTIASAAAVVVGLVCFEGCLADEARVPLSDVDAASEAAVTTDAEADADARPAISCDAAPPTAPQFQVGCLADGGTCNSQTSECCEQGLGFACAAKGACDPRGFNCDKASDCTTGICCMAILKPDTSTCLPSGKTSAGTTCTSGTTCGIGQLELCVSGQACQDTSTKCQSVNVAVVGDFDVVVGSRTVGICF